jgi:hypothetical protein
MNPNTTRRTPGPGHEGGRDRAARRRFVPRLENLEGRECPSTLTVGTNLNLTQVRDNQTEGTITIDPTNPQRMFTSAMSFHGDYVGAVNNMPGMGLFVSHTTTGGAGPWVGGFIARGTDDLPMAHGHPRASFDAFGNLFLTYFTSSPLHMGVSTGSTETTLTDLNAHWGTNEWCSHGDGFVDVTVNGNLMRRRIVSNDVNTLTIDSPWDVIPPPGTPYFIHLDAGAHTVALVMSTDGGQSFSWVANFALSAGTSGPGTSPPDDQPMVATGPGGGTAPGSVWVYWQNSGVGTFAATVAGAPVYGLGQVGSFGAPQSPSNASGKKFGSIAVGPSGQLLLAYQSDLEMMSWPYHATVYTALDPDGLGPAPFNSPGNTVWTNVMLRYPIPASPNMPINAAAHLAWDRSGGPHNGRVYLVYTDRPSLFTSDTNIMFRYSDDNGSTWSAATRLNDDTGTANQFWPSLAVDQTSGNVAAVWYDARNDPQNIRVNLYATASDDGGATFAPNAAVSAGQSYGSGAEDHMRGTSTGGNGPRTLNDTTQNWAINWWGPYGNVPLTQVHIIAGTGADPNTFYDIVGNSATQIVIDRDWAVIPDNTSVYEFVLRYQYAFGGYTDVAYHGGVFYPAWADNSNSTLDNPDGANKPLDIYTAAVTLNSGGGSGGGGLGGGGGGGGFAPGSGINTTTTPLAPTADRSPFLPPLSAAAVKNPSPVQGGTDPGGPSEPPSGGVLFIAPDRVAPPNVAPEGDARAASPPPDATWGDDWLIDLKPA